MATSSLSINDLPPEILSNIFRFIQPLETLLAVSCTCRLWRRIINGEWFLNNYFEKGIQNDELIGWWKFEDANNIGHDSSGVLNDRFEIFGQPTIEDSFLGKCILFDGCSFIDVPVEDKSEYQTDLYSVAIWFWADPMAWNKDEREGGWRTAIGSWNDQYYSEHAWLHLGFHVDLNIHNQVMISPAQYSFICRSEQKMEPCRWYHVVVRVNRNRQELWIDGRLVNSVDMTDPYNHYQIRVSNRPWSRGTRWDQQKMHLPDVLHIGSKNREHHNPWRGKIADVSIWRRWLKPYEIRALFEQRTTIDKVKIGSFIHSNKIYEESNFL